MNDFLDLLFSSRLTYGYVLELNNGTYYIGKSDDLFSRLMHHCANPEVSWIRLGGGIKRIAELFPLQEFEEDRMTKIYMRQYGVDKVRGGAYCSMQLDEHTKQHIMKEIQSTNSDCYICGKHGHFARDCISRH